MTEKLTIEATIPTVQYGNIKPTIELEGEDFDTIRDLGLKRIKEISDMTAGDGYQFEVRGLSVPSGQQVSATILTPSGPKTLVSELTGVTLYFDEATHVYRDAKGVRYSSSSAFPNKFYPKFDSEMIIKQMIDKNPQLNAAEILAMWKLNSEASTGYGTAIHAALENYDKNRALGEVLRNGIEDSANKALSKNAFLKQIVEWFHEHVASTDKDDVMTEAFVANEEFQICGRIDRLKFIDREKKIVRVQDYKTDGDIQDKKYQVAGSPFKAVPAAQVKKGAIQNPNAIENTLVGFHRLQLSHLAFMLEKAGYTVEGTDIFWLNPAKLIKGENPWETFSSKVVDITKGLK